MRIALFLPAVLAFVPLMLGQATGSESTAAKMEPMLAQLKNYQYGDSRVVQAQFTQLVQDSLSSPALLKTIEARLLQFLQSDATKAGKDFAFRELGLIATDASIPILKPMLSRPETSEMARYALGRISGPMADEALLSSLARTTEKIQIGIINSLGQRRSATAVPALSALLSSSDVSVAEAAAAALATIANRPALDALAVSHRSVSNPVRQQISEAYLECADQFAARGDHITASGVYKQFLGPAESDRFRAHALVGMVNTAGQGAISTLIAEMESKDPEMQAVAIRLLGQVRSPVVTTTFVREYPKLPPAGQVRVLTALAARGDASARPVFLAAIKSNVATVRIAGLTALGKVGDNSSVMVLATAAADSEPIEQTAARQSLDSLPGSSVDAVLTSAINSSDGKIKAELIMAAGQRGIMSAANAIASAIGDNDPDVHRAALHAMKNVADSVQIPVLVNLILQASTPTDRDDATQALVSAIERSQGSQIAPVVAAYRSTSALQPRLSFLDVMGQTSQAEALPVLRSGLKDPNPEINHASIVALSEWDNPSPLNDLLAEVKSGNSQALRLQALQGFLKVISVPSPRSNSESVKLLYEAMQLAQEPLEKKAILMVLPDFPCQESLELAKSSLNDQTVASDAKTSVERINRLMATSHDAI